ncbi:MAG: hypothetical protein NZM25_04985 [Leptospiraceae bacterium]|nr:hypothetical protein [Leptospiraceae bacterium]MDW8305635.1 hypothetical protein [Leptospiraceae bacterium]
MAAKGHKDRQVLLIFSLFLAGCSVADPVPLDYFRGTERIKGGNAPPPVVLSYEPETKMFSWSMSIDPDTGEEVPVYFFYYARGKLPSYLHSEDYFITAERRNRSLILDWVSLPPGRHFFWVTAYDGGRESLPSNIIELLK